MKHCVITGSNRGVGLELVKAYLSRDTWHVHACCREPEKADALRELVTSNLGRITLHSLDVTNAVLVQKLGEALSGQPIDLLINNAGIMGGDRQTLGDIDYDAWAHTLAVNTIAPMRIAQTLLPGLRAASNAKIVTISSQLGALSYISTGKYAYNSSKAAVNKVMKTLALELKDEGITCVLFHPGWVQTDMGGPSADITPCESAQGIADTTDRLTIADTGGFFKWNGETHPW
ncbi:SDR family oxidoreductase [Cohaesibacter celericrescens]|uniref:Short chain dehydrogenase n=1 Tax=Cohaesibacter celericrescens TaxID=2067669 RepID=A0A2N5XN10_9HYPH|nr:SDR family oxidoreductase [Cohaesibacter celericrescens]PLW75883.1 Short chain dehydrogenase [Cohaesibacter celericrescens]